MSHAAPFMIALALVAGIAVQLVARTLRVPAIILLLGAGVALGPVGVDWIDPRLLGDALFAVVDFAVAVILFEGALNLRINRLRREERVIRRLITLGALVTLVGGALASWLWLDWPWQMAVLFGSLVVVTGPTVVSPLVRDLRLHPRLQTVLEAEGVLIDPVGALLAALVFQVTFAVDASSVMGSIGTLMGRVAFGTLLGALGGLLIVGLLRLPRVVHGYENALTLAMVVFLFYAGDRVMAPSGLLVVTVAGLVVGALQGSVDELREFKDQLTVLFVGAVFILLAADVGIDDVRALGGRGLLVLAALVLVVRPLGVWWSTRGTALNTRERVFVAAIAPRGIVAAAVTSVIANTIDAAGPAGGQQLRAMVFLVIIGTVVAAGALAWPLASLLRLRLPRRDRVAILGAQGLGLALGRVLRDAGRTVVFIDSDPSRCRAAEEEGFQVVYGDGLQERTLRRVPIELVGTALGVTFNDHLNTQFARLAREAFRVPRTAVSVETLDKGRPPEHVVKSGADVLFDGPHDQERWDSRARHGQLEIVTMIWAGPQDGPGTVQPAKGDGDRAVVLAISRGPKVMPMAMGMSLKPGDRGHIAIEGPRRAEVLQKLIASGWRPVAQEDRAVPGDPAAAAE